MYYPTSDNKFNLIPPENIPRVHLLGHVVQARVIAVGYDGLRLGLERGEVIDHAAAEEEHAVLEGRLIDYHLGALGLDALHDALDGALAEIV